MSATAWRVRFIGGVLHGRWELCATLPMIQAIALAPLGPFARDHCSLRTVGGRSWMGFDGRSVPTTLPRWMRRSWIEFQRKDAR